jgi:predicted butyrate kinase (DUF1464 family)
MYRRLKIFRHGPGRTGEFLGFRNLVSRQSGFQRKLVQSRVKDKVAIQSKVSDNGYGYPFNPVQNID